MLEVLEKKALKDHVDRSGVLQAGLKEGEALWNEV
jgi:hypothetical protein